MNVLNGLNGLKLRLAGRDETMTLVPQRLIVAGYTARDAAAVAAHIDELAAIGVPRPRAVPAFYDLDPALLTTADEIEVSGSATSGEVEPVLIRRGDRFYLAVGSDHTDRGLERVDIATAKAACPKPVGGVAVEIGTDLAALDWEHLTVESSVDGRPYQQGSAATLRHPADLLGRLAAAAGEVAGDLILFCGTLPLLSGAFDCGVHWQVRLRLADGTTLAHSYQAKQRSV